jgi:hypothetical protein
MKLYQLKVNVFQEGTWSFWFGKSSFLACYAYQKCDQILLDIDIQSPPFDSHLNIKDSGDWILFDYTKQSLKAYMLLSLCVSPSGTITFNPVQNSTADALPSGDIKQKWKNSWENNQPTASRST